MTTNEQLIEMMFPVLDEILKLDNSPHVVDVQVNVSRKEGIPVLQVTAYAYNERIEAPSIEELVAAVKVEKARLRKLEQLAAVEEIAAKLRLELGANHS